MECPALPPSSLIQFPVCSCLSALKPRFSITETEIASFAWLSANLITSLQVLQLSFTATLKAGSASPPAKMPHTRLTTTPDFAHSDALMAHSGSMTLQSAPILAPQDTETTQLASAWPPVLSVPELMAITSTQLVFVSALVQPTTSLSHLREHARPLVLTQLLPTTTLTTPPGSVYFSARVHLPSTIPFNVWRSAQAPTSPSLITPQTSVCQFAPPHLTTTEIAMFVCSSAPQQDIMLTPTADFVCPLAPTLRPTFNMAIRELASARRTAAMAIGATIRPIYALLPVQQVRTRTTQLEYASRTVQRTKVFMLTLFCTYALTLVREATSAAKSTKHAFPNAMTATGVIPQPPSALRSVQSRYILLAKTAREPV